MTDHSLHTDLFSPTQLGGLSLANRFVMAPLTRSRAGDDGVPTELHAAYYAQRASAGLLISEAVNISAQGRGYNLTPGIWTEQQVAGWKDRKSTRLNSSHLVISYAVFCLKKKNRLT